MLSPYMLSPFAIYMLSPYYFSQVSVADEDGNPLKVTIGDIDSDNKEVKFSPENPGSHHVTVTWSDMPVPGGEVDVEVR